MRPRGTGRKGRSLFLNRQHRPSGNPRSCSSPALGSRIWRLWGCDGDLGRGRNLKAAAPRHAETNDPHHRLVSYCHGDPAHTADRRSHRALLSASSHRQGRQNCEVASWHGRVGRAIRDLEQLPRTDSVAACCIASLRSHNIEDVRPSLLSYRLAWLDQPAPRCRILRLCGIACTRQTA